VIEKEKNKGIKIALVLLPLAAIIVSLFIGRYHANPMEIIGLLVSKLPFFTFGPFPATMECAIIQVRLPRIIIATLVGMSLAISGASFQGVFRNPLVSSHILGVANGASFGAALAILFGAPIMVVQLAAFATGMLSVILTYTISRVYGTSSTLTLVLSGVIVGAFFAALVSLMKYAADPLEKLPAIVFWLMGSFAKCSAKDLFYSAPAMVISIIALLLVRWRINVLSMGEEDARALGVDTERFRLVIIFFSTLATASAVAVGGVIGWVGLVIPHVGRILVGPDHKVLLPASIALGGTYLLLMDDLARTMSSAEIPLGILTAMVGAPFFAYLLRKGARWS
jgi:iron complex transport system permease protein